MLSEYNFHQLEIAVDIFVDKDDDKKENHCVVFLYFILVHKK